MTVSDINTYVEKKSKTSENLLSLEDTRTSFRMASTYDRMRGYTINSNDLFPHLNTNIELSIVDIINSKIIIDTYKLISKKLNCLKCYDEKSNFYAKRLVVLNLQSAIYKLSMREMSELLAMDTLFEIDNIPNIDLKHVEKLLYRKLGKILDIRSSNRRYADVINLFDRLQINEINPDNPVSIYDNLFSVSYLEILLDYLTIGQLKAISSYYEKINIKDKLIANNIKTLLKNKFNT